MDDSNETDFAPAASGEKKMDTEHEVQRSFPVRSVLVPASAPVSAGTFLCITGTRYPGRQWRPGSSPADARKENDYGVPQNL